MADRANPLETTSDMPSESDQSERRFYKIYQHRYPIGQKAQGKRLDSYVPQNLEAPIQKALDTLEAKVGNVDEFVADALNFGSVRKSAQCASG